LLVFDGAEKAIQPGRCWFILATLLQDLKTQQFLNMLVNAGQARVLWKSP